MTRLTWMAVAAAVLITAWTAAYLAVVYPSLPYGIPVRFEDGRPLIYQVKSPLMVALPAVVQVGLLTVFGLLMTLLLWGGQRRMRPAAEGVALLAALWIAVQALGAIRLITLWQYDAGGFDRFYGLSVVAAIAGSVLIAVRTRTLLGDQRGLPITRPREALLLAGVLVAGIAGPYVFARYVLHAFTLGD